MYIIYTPCFAHIKTYPLLYLYFYLKGYKINENKEKKVKIRLNEPEVY